MESFDSYPEQPSYYAYTDSNVQDPTGFDSPDNYQAGPRQSSRERIERHMPEQSKYIPPDQPNHETVTTASGRADSTATLHPELIAQITETVIKQLRTAETGGSISMMQPQHPPPPPQQPIPRALFTASDASPPKPVNTPPSPLKYSDHHTNGPNPAPRSPTELFHAQADERRPSSRASVSSEANPARPRGPPRLSTAQEETPMEKIWGPLFDEESHPTARLGQLLRGLAVHLIEDYEPCHSIVVTPMKMVKYYDSVRLTNEDYPWSDIFDDKVTALSRMYRELECQYHLVQDRLDERPCIPSLTPVGFEKWMTLLIQAHPNEEFGRLKRAVLEMPISNPDNKKERFPKEISRRLFPPAPDYMIRERIQQAMAEHASITLPKNAHADVLRDGFSQPSSRKTSEAGMPEPAYPLNNIERARKPYAGVPSECAIEDTNIPMAQSNERDRKSYFVPPGGGKVYEEDGRTAMPNRSGRSNSINSSTRPIQIPHRVQAEQSHPEIHHHHRGSMSHRRRNSPSGGAAGNNFRRSDADLRMYPPAGYQPSSMSTHESYDDDDRRLNREADIRRAEYARRQGDEDASSYGASPSSRARYESRAEPNDQRRGMSQTEGNYHRGAGRQGGGGYDYAPSYGAPTYR